MRTQRVPPYETNVTNVADRLGDSCYVESLTNEIERQTLDYFCRIEEFGVIERDVRAARMRM